MPSPLFPDYMRAPARESAASSGAKRATAGRRAISVVILCGQDQFKVVAKLGRRSIQSPIEAIPFCRPLHQEDDPS
jgi:hypothetical protein